MSATNVAFVPLANNKCNTCGHLVSHAKNFHDNCHFTKGNANCPAKVFQLGVGVNVEKASQAIAEAFHACDVEALQKHINRLAGFKPVQTREVLSLEINPELAATARAWSSSASRSARGGIWSSRSIIAATAPKRWQAWA